MNQSISIVAMKNRPHFVVENVIITIPPEQLNQRLVEICTGDWSYEFGKQKTPMDMIDFADLVFGRRSRMNFYFTDERDAVMFKLSL
jgi:hypothetical protein